MPGDAEAIVGQRPIAIHALEHLASSDHGVLRLRRMLQRAIDAVRRGGDPIGVIRDPACSRRDRRHQAGLPGGLQRKTLHHSRERLLRMEA
jgi:hypothetical protein